MFSMTNAQMASFSMYGNVLATLTQTAGAFYAARAEAAYYKGYEKLARVAARDTLAQGAREEQAIHYKYAQIKGTQRATMAAHGLALDQGTPLEILTGTDMMEAIDVATTHDNAAKKAWAYRVEAEQYHAAAPNPWIAAGNSLMEQAGSVAEKWKAFGDSGAWDNGGGSIWGSAWRSSAKRGP